MDQTTLRGTTFNHVSAAIVAGTTSTYTTTVATACSIRGKFATSLGTQTNTASPTTDAGTGAAFVPLTDNQTCALVWGISAAGAIQLLQGPIVATEVGVTTTAGAFIVPPQFPAIPETICPIAYCVVRTAPSASDFTPGTSSWAATGVTTSTFQNVSTLPDRPQTS